MPVFKKEFLLRTTLYIKNKQDNLKKSCRVVVFSLTKNGVAVEIIMGGFRY